MHIQISVHDGVPIYRQIVNQVKYLVASGQLLPEEELPAIRVLAKQLLVTPNTIVKAYDELKKEGVVQKRHGSGTYVTDALSPLAKREQKKILSERADALLAEARQMNYALPEVMELIQERHERMINNKEARHGRTRS